MAVAECRRRIVNDTVARVTQATKAHGGAATHLGLRDQELHRDNIPHVA